MVGQRVEMEPALGAALERPAQAGVGVFTTAPAATVVADVTPLGISFNHSRRTAPGFGRRRILAVSRLLQSESAAVRERSGTCTRPARPIIPRYF